MRGLSKVGGRGNKAGQMGAAAGKSLHASEANHDQGNSGGDMGYIGDIGKQPSAEDSIYGTVSAKFHKNYESISNF